MNPAGSANQTRLHGIFDSFNKAWLKYWDSYIALQNQLDESLRAAREVQWLCATDQEKLSEVNRLQRELFASMPRRLDYTPLGQVSQDLDSAPSKIEELMPRVGDSPTYVGFEPYRIMAPILLGPNS